MGNESKMQGNERCGAQARRMAETTVRNQHRGLRSLRPVGFTILELMVVSVVIATLAVMLLPILATARESARRTQCRSNLSQLGKATTMYSEHFKEMMPEVLPPPGTSTAELHNGTDKNGLGKLYPSYNRDPRLFYCPSANHYTVDGASGFGHWGSGAVISSFYYRGTVDGTETLVVTDTKAIAMDYNQEAAIGRYNHGGRFVNILFTDGHVTGVGDDTQKAAEPNPVDLWAWADRQ